MNSSAVAKWLVFSLYFGAAMHDASPTQRASLRNCMEPVLRNLRSDDPDVWKPAVRNAFEVITVIMGEQWEPTGAWADNINSLMGKDDAVQIREAAPVDVGEQAQDGSALG